jgi:mRNA-degrading endonuclease HigB of HigAB toxin-antitoxin module
MVVNRTQKLWQGPSASDQYLSDRSSVPQVSAIMANSVSQQRRQLMSDEVEAGYFRDGSSPRFNENGPTSNSAVISSVGMKKYGQATSSVGGMFRGIHGDSVKQTPEVYSPLWLNSNLNLPRDRATINAWCRSFFALNPFVHNAICLHSTYPISKLSIKCPNKDIEKFFNDMIEEIDLMNICVQIAQEYWLLGEAFVYAELDESRGRWSRLMIQNPDYMIVKRTVVANEPIIMLRPDENLKKIIFSNRPTDIEQRKQLNNHIIDSVKRGENIPLDNFHVSHLARRISPYEIRGTGLPVCIFRQLMLFDKLRESKYAQADNMINPLTIVKIGSADYKPTFADLEAWRAVFEEAQYDKDFKIFTHEGVDVTRVGYNTGIFDISGDITQLIKEIYVGLQVPPVMMDGGADTTYANGGVALDVLRQRYMQFRNMMGQWLKRKIFAPVSKIQGFYDYSGGEKQLIVPEIDWNHMSLFDAGDYIQALITLTMGDGPAKRASLHTLYRSMGLEYEDEQRKIRREAIQDSINKKEKAALEAMDLNALRALDDEDEITEVEGSNAEQAEAPLPGETPGGAPPAMPGGLDLGPPPSPGGSAPPAAPPSAAPAGEAPAPPAPPAPGG